MSGAARAMLFGHKEGIALHAGAKRLAAVTVKDAALGCIHTFTDLPATETAGGLKRALQAKSGTSRFQLRLFFGECEVGDEVSLGSLEPLLLSLRVVPYVEIFSGSVIDFQFKDVISDNDMEELENLLRLPADPKRGLEWAAFFAHDEAMELLLDAAADPNYECWHYFEALDNVIPTTALHIAIAEADEPERHFATNVVAQLCAAGANVNAVDGEGDAPITVATRCGNMEAVRLLCAARADVDFAAPQGDDNCGNTALQKAAWKGDADMVQLLLEMRANPDFEDDDGGLTALGAATWVASDGLNTLGATWVASSGAMRNLLAARANVDAGRTSPLALAMERHDYESSQLLLQAGASQAKALASRSVADDAVNVFFIGHQNTEAQRRAVAALIEAHNADAGWMSWYKQKNLSIAHRVVLPPQDAPHQHAFYGWRGSVNHCTHGVLCNNSGRAARETSYEFLRNYDRGHGLQLTIRHLDQEMMASMRLLPCDPERVYQTLLCLRAFRGGALAGTVCTSVAQFAS